MNISEKFNTYIVFDPGHVEKYTTEKTVSATEKKSDVRDIAASLRQAVCESFPYEPAIRDLTGEFPAVSIRTTAEQAEQLQEALGGLTLQKK